MLDTLDDNHAVIVLVIILDITRQEYPLDLDYSPFNSPFFLFVFCLFFFFNLFFYLSIYLFLVPMRGADGGTSDHQPDPFLEGSKFLALSFSYFTRSNSSLQLSFCRR